MLPRSHTHNTHTQMYCMVHTHSSLKHECLKQQMYKYTNWRTGQDKQQRYAFSPHLRQGMMRVASSTCSLGAHPHTQSICQPCTMSAVLCVHTTAPSSSVFPSCCEYEVKSVSNVIVTWTNHMHRSAKSTLVIVAPCDYHMTDRFTSYNNISEVPAHTWR